jgi:DNA-binding transcriptional MocR family regulator
MKRYEKLADDIAQMMTSGLILAGERLPSIRQACTSFQVSPATVFKAYYLLESQGLIRAKEKSGYYALAQATCSTRHAFQQAHHQAQLSDVSVSDLVFSLLDSVQDRAIIPFGSAFPSPELFPTQRLARSAASAMRFMDGQALIAEMPLGMLELRRHIAQRYALNDVLLGADDILITTGAMEALNLCLQAVTQPGDYVAIESPTFYASLQVLERLQLKAVEIPVHPETGLDLHVLAQALAQYPVKACWCMTSFQNPTGASLSEANKQALVGLLTAHQVPLIEDDVYHELYFADTPPKPAKAYDVDGWVMHCSSFSKSLAPGYRIGWVSAGRFSEKVKRLKQMTTISASIPAQAILNDYLQHGGYDRHLRLLRQQLRQQYEQLRQAILRYFPQSTRIAQPQGGYFLWLALPPQVNTLELFRLALQQGISIAPGPMFSATQGLQNHVRLNFGMPWSAELEQAVQQLAALVKTLSQEPPAT